jgi:hypothetical protein
MIDRFIGALAIVIVAATGAAAQTKYPLVISSESKLKQLGMWLGYMSQLPNRCYHYGDGGNSISLSDALLAFYQSQGFSRRSACMALISGIRFNPETGARLATFVWVDPKLFKNGRPDPRYWTQGMPTDVGDISDELPLSLPRCFARGLPLSDCNWRYHVLSGKRMSAADIAKHAEAGRKAEQFLSSARARQRFDADPSHPGEGGFIHIAGSSRNWNDRDDTDDWRPPWLDIKFDYAGVEMDLAMFHDYASEFPKGFGYALLYVNDGGAGPDASPDTIKAAIEGQRRPPQIDVDKLKDIWSAGSN